MSTLRALFLTLLVAALLPWGAWRGVGLPQGAEPTAAAVATEAAAASLHPSELRRSELPSSDLRPAELRPADRCRGPSLPGSPCAHVLLPPAAVLPAARDGQSLAPGGPERRTGIVPPGALDPPRPV